MLKPAFLIDAISFQAGISKKWAVRSGQPILNTDTVVFMAHQAAQLLFLLLLWIEFFSCKFLRAVLLLPFVQAASA